MTMGHNPTKTKSIEKAWLRDIRRRWAKFSTETISKLSVVSIANAKNPRLDADVFSLSADEFNEYIKFFDLKIDEILLGTNEAPNWQARYQLESYLRGLKKAEASIVAQGVRVASSGVAPAITAISAHDRDDGLSIAMASRHLRPKHQESVEFLFDRSYESLNGWTDKLRADVRQVIKDSIDQESSIKQTTMAVKEKIGVSKSRAELIARTETNAAYNDATISEAEALEEILGEEVLIRWTSALSPTTRHLHGSWHGDLITSKEARKRKQAPHIFNCKCSSSPAIESAQTHRMNAKFKKEKDLFYRRESELNTR